MRSFIVGRACAGTTGFCFIRQKHLSPRALVGGEYRLGSSDRLFLMRPFVLNLAQQRRLQRLARDAKRSPVESFRYVLRDGFELCDWEVLERFSTAYNGK